MREKMKAEFYSRLRDGRVRRHSLHEEGGHLPEPQMCIAERLGSIRALAGLALGLVFLYRRLPWVVSVSTARVRVRPWAVSPLRLVTL